MCEQGLTALAQHVIDIQRQDVAVFVEKFCGGIDNGASKVKNGKLGYAGILV